AVNLLLLLGELSRELSFQFAPDRVDLIPNLRHFAAELHTLGPDLLQGLLRLLVDLAGLPVGVSFNVLDRLARLFPDPSDLVSYLLTRHDHLLLRRGVQSGDVDRGLDSEESKDGDENADGGPYWFGPLQ